MTAEPLDGRAMAAGTRRERAGRVAERAATGGRPPGLGTVLVREDPGSRAHAGKHRDHRDRAPVGIASLRRETPAGATRRKVEDVIDEFDADPDRTGCVVRLPPTLHHTGTEDLARHTREADLVVAAAGTPGPITPDMPGPGAAVLDVGITRTADGPVGDAHPDAAGVAGRVAPMPGGVGPMTRATPLAPVVEAAERNTA